MNPQLRSKIKELVDMHHNKLRHRYVTAMGGLSGVARANARRMTNGELVVAIMEAEETGQFAGPVLARVSQNNEPLKFGT